MEKFVTSSFKIRIAENNLITEPVSGIGKAKFNWSHFFSSKYRI